MKPNATIPAMTPMFRDFDGALITFAYDIRAYVKIIPEDIQVSEVLYKGFWYTIDTAKVRFD